MTTSDNIRDIRDRIGTTEGHDIRQETIDLCDAIGTIASSHDALLRRVEALERQLTPKPNRRICDGCNVIGVCEHRCHGEMATVFGEWTGLPCECSQCQPHADHSASAGKPIDDHIGKGNT